MADFGRGSTVLVSPKLQYQVGTHLHPGISHYTPKDFSPVQVQGDEKNSTPIILPRPQINIVGGTPPGSANSVIPQDRSGEHPCPLSTYPTNFNGFPIKLNYSLQLVPPGPHDAEKCSMLRPANDSLSADVYPVQTPQPPPMASRDENNPYGDAHDLLQDSQQLEDSVEVADQIEAGSTVLDNESVADGGYESDSATSASTSVSSSIWDFSFENGRRYHKFREGRYNFPNDDVEQEREDMKHAMVKLLCQKLHFAPIGDNPHEILDVGTVLESGRSRVSPSSLILWSLSYQSTDLPSGRCLSQRKCSWCRLKSYSTAMGAT